MVVDKHYSKDSFDEIGIVESIKTKTSKPSRFLKPVIPIPANQNLNSSENNEKNDIMEN